MLQKMRERGERRPRASFLPSSFFRAHVLYHTFTLILTFSQGRLEVFITLNSFHVTSLTVPAPPPVLALWSKTVKNDHFVWSIASQRALRTWSNHGTVSQMTTFILHRNIGCLEESSKLRWMFTLWSHKKRDFPPPNQVCCPVWLDWDVLTLTIPDVLQRNKVESGYGCHPYMDLKKLTLNISFSDLKCISYCQWCILCERTQLWGRLTFKGYVNQHSKDTH